MGTWRASPPAKLIYLWHADHRLLALLLPYTYKCTGMTRPLDCHRSSHWFENENVHDQERIPPFRISAIQFTIRRGHNLPPGSPTACPKSSGRQTPTPRDDSKRAILPPPSPSWGSAATRSINTPSHERRQVLPPVPPQPRPPPPREVRLVSRRLLPNPPE
jgi:hypothetical protein